MPSVKETTTSNANSVTSREHSSKERCFENNIPKNLFMYWHQGWHNAPDMIRRCPQRFFAYDKPGPDRPISSWFLAAGKECRIVDLWHSAVLHLLAKTQAYARFGWVSDNKEKNWLLNTLSRLCMGYLLRRYNYGHLVVTSSNDPEDDNYFWFHYLFGRLLEQNNEFRQLWTSTPKISADGPQLLRRGGLLKPATDRTELLIREKASNVHKLTHRLALPDDIAGTVLDSLYHSGECN